MTPNSEDKTLAAPDKRCPWLRASIDLPGQDSRLASRRSSVTGCRRPSVSKAEDGRGCGGCWPSIASTVPARGQPQYDGHSMNWHGRWSSCALGQGLLGESTIVFLLRVSSRHFLFSEIQGPCGSKGTIADSGYVPLQSVCSRGIDYRHGAAAGRKLPSHAGALAACGPPRHSRHIGLGR